MVAGTDPTDEESTTDLYVEVAEGAIDVTYDFTLETELQTVDIAFLIDTTCSMDSTRAAMAEFDEMQDQIEQCSDGTVRVRHLRRLRV